MTEYTAKRVILKDASGNYLIPFTESELPSQTNNSGKYLTTNGTVASWGEIQQSSYHPDIFSHQWCDHILNNMSWLRADTYSWQSGVTYTTAYNELVSEYNSSVQKYYAYQSVFETERYLKSTTLTVGAQVYKLQAGAMVNAGTISDIDENYFVIGGEGAGDTGPYGRDISGDVNFPLTETEGGITFRRTPKGYKIADATQETAILNKYNTDGIAWYYILDTTNTQFKLPRTKFGFEGLRTSVGDDIAESLPNIKGRLNDLQGNFTSAGTGALSGSSRKTGYTYYSATDSTNKADLLFNASLSSSTYQDGAPVQERATQMYLYFYVGEYAQSAIEQTAGITSEQLNAKVDVASLSTINPMIISYVNGTSGYNIWANGYCEQWGMSIDNYNITLSKTYSNTDYSIQLTAVYGPLDSTVRSMYVSDAYGDITTGGFLVCSKPTGWGGHFFWKTSGYLAEGQY